MILVGKVLNTHGIKGDLKIKSFSDNKDRFKKGNEIYFEGIKDPYEIINSSKIKDNIIISLSNLNDINDALHFKTKNIYIKEQDLMKLSDDEYFVFDLYDLAVYENEKKIGIIDDVLTNYPNDVYVVKTTDNKQLYIPAIKEYVLNIDIDNKRIDVKDVDKL
ncbi:MAG: ribosome maturation factor RimM [Tissierellia bacterium]|nr:ribosome maturation factor RimM [Tissierellia bacterium]